MILYVLKQNKNRNSPAFGKYFAYPVIEETVTLDGLAEHMSNHNTPYSKGAIKGMLTDMVSCIKELLLEGKNVKIADLAIFSLGIKNNVGAVSEETLHQGRETACPCHRRTDRQEPEPGGYAEEGQRHIEDEWQRRWKHSDGWWNVAPRKVDTGRWKNN